MARLFRHYVPRFLLLTATLDALVVIAAVQIGLLLPVGRLSPSIPSEVRTLVGASILAFLVVVMNEVVGLYDLRRGYGRRELMVRLGAAFTGAYLVFAFVAYLLHFVQIGRKAFIFSFLTALPALLVLRVVSDRAWTDQRRRQSVLLLGAGSVSQSVGRAVLESPHAYELLGCVGAPSEPADAAELPYLGTLDDLEWLSKLMRPDIIVVALEERRGSLPVSEIVECKLRGIQVEDWPGFYEKLTGKIPIENLRPSWLVFADGFTKPRLTIIFKRALDIVGSLAGLIVGLPVLAVAAALIRWDSRGPAFFRQERLGQYGRVYSVVKFRSMHVDAHEMEAPRDGEPDLRITKVGRWLRRTRIDELPQLFNVLLGEMSLVGPRPEWVALVPEFRQKVPFYLHRLAAKPGITGWAQVKNPYGATVENTMEKLQYDLYYIKNMSLFLDVLILLHTVQIVLFTRGSGGWKVKSQAESTTSVSYAG